MKEINKSWIMIQARMSSQRFPGKMLKSLAGIPLVEYVFLRCKTSQIGNVLIITSDHRSDDVLNEYCFKKDIPVFRGSLDNVLKRYIQASQAVGAKYIVRVCGDTPFVDVKRLDRCAEALIAERLDYVCYDRSRVNSGFFSESVTVGALEKSYAQAEDSYDLEHVTSFILKNPDRFSIKLLKHGLSKAKLNLEERLTIDHPSDMDKANEILKGFRNVFNFDCKDVIDVLRSNRIAK